MRRRLLLFHAPAAAAVSALVVRRALSEEPGPPPYVDNYYSQTIKARPTDDRVDAACSWPLQERVRCVPNRNGSKTSKS
jgi:hypothetical protein